MVNRFMRLLIMFDLPTATKEDKREYSRFRNGLVKMGFSMLQFSIYMRIMRNNDDAQKYLRKVKDILPSIGSIRTLQITEKQYSAMEVLLGDKTPTENLLEIQDIVEL